MNMRLVFGALTILFLVSCGARSFLDDYLTTYREILLAFEEEEHRLLGKFFDKGTHELVVKMESLKKLLNLHDDDAKCGTGCQIALIRYITHDGLPFGHFEKIIRDIYGQEISEDPYQPQEVHLALHAESTSMNVMWVTMESLDNPIVQYREVGAAEDNWNEALESHAETSTYRVPKKWWPIFTGTIYSADMHNLEHEKEYIYRVGGYSSVNASMRFSDQFKFKAAPNRNSDPNRKTIAATFADHGTFELFGFKTIDKLVELYNDGRGQDRYEFVHVAGDLSYAGLSTAFTPLNISKEDEFEHIWDLLAIQNQPVAAQVPWMVSDGNHERFYDWAAFKARFTMPSSSEAIDGFDSNGNFWYTYQYGNSQWISLDSESDMSDGSPQMLFLETALQAAEKNRERVPWVVVTLHKPLYCSAKGTPGGFADKLEITLNEYGVDLVVVGHMHAYERVHPVQDGEVTVQPSREAWGPAGEEVDVYLSTGQGPVQIVQGNSGGMQEVSWNQPQPAWSAFRCSNGFVPKSEDSTQALEHALEIELNGGMAEGVRDYDYKDTYGFGLVTFANATHLQYRSIPVTGTIGYDEFWVVKA